MGEKGSLGYPGWRSTRGSKSRTAKLNEENVLKILRSKKDMHDLAKEYGVTWSCISDIKKRRKWRHVEWDGSFDP